MDDLKPTLKKIGKNTLDLIVNATNIVGVGVPIHLIAEMTENDGRLLLSEINAIISKLTDDEISSQTEIDRLYRKLNAVIQSRIGSNANRIKRAKDIRDQISENNSKVSEIRSARRQAEADATQAGILTGTIHQTREMYPSLNQSVETSVSGRPGPR